MTTSDTSTAMPAPDAPADERRLRRSRTSRVGAGVAGGLGEYFAVDPVLFRVLFATSAFFGGAGILAYLLAWAAIPDAGTERAAIDRWVGELRRRHVPPWLVITVAGVLLWAVAFSWWAPGPFVPVVAVVVVVLVVAFARHDLQRPDAAPTAPPTVDLSKGDEDATRPLPPATSGEPTWVREGRAWLAESHTQGRERRRERRRRALPVKIAALGALGAALIVLAIIDSAGGIPIHTYFWTSTAILVAGLVVGGVLRRTPWSIAALLPLAVAGNLAFSTTSAQFGDGVGNKQWRPMTVPAAHYRLAFGQGELDLRGLPEQTVPRTIDVRVAAGQVTVLAPASMNLTVHAHVTTAGQIELDGGARTTGHGGIAVDRTLDPPAGATGAAITVNVHVADGQITVRR